MTSVECRELVEFLEIRFDRADTSRAEIEDRLTRRIVGVEDRLTGVEDRLTGVEDRLTGVEGRLTGVEGRLAGLEGRLTGVEIGNESLRNDLRALTSRFDGLEATVSARFDDHERRIVRLE